MGGSGRRVGGWRGRKRLMIMKEEVGDRGKRRTGRDLKKKKKKKKLKGKKKK